MPNFDAAAAYQQENDQDGDEQQTQDPNQQGQGTPLTIPPDVVAQMQQLKASGNMQGLGELVAQLIN